MWESMSFCHVAHSIKRIEILLNHIRDKNNFKNRDSLFYFCLIFQDYFLLHFIQYCFKTIICFIWFNVSRLFFSLTHKKLFAFSFTIFTSTLLYTYAHSPPCYLISNTLKQKTMSFTLKSSTLQRHLHNSNIVILLILTHTSRL